ncbi:MAG: porin [Pseudomonadota bacterium]|nr:porin [Pseudomonadota bacterium]
MKKSLLALAALSLVAGTAAAQSSVTMYGIADVGIVHESGNPAGSVNKVTSGVSAGSRLGFRGIEDLGGGMAALFVLETGINYDTGGNAQLASAANPAGAAFGRQTFVGIKSSAGTLTLGRQYNPYFKTVNAVDPFGTGQEGNSGNIMSFTGSNGRSANSIQYVSPVAGGFSAELLYAFGEVLGDTSASRVINGALSYTNGPFLIRLAHQRQNNPDTSIDAARNTILASNYDFGVAKLQLAYAVARGQRSIANAQETVGFYAATPYRAKPLVPLALTDADVRDYLIGTTIPVGAGNILASYIRRQDRSAAGQNAKQIAIGYEYNLSKRTTLYTAFSRIINENGAGYTVGNSGDITAGSGDHGTSLGVRHTF